MVKHCHRCGLPRRRSLLTPDGKTFSFPGFAVRRHRGLLLASGAALCCCCTELEALPISDSLIDSWWEDSTGGDADGSLFDEIDESPPDDATTFLRAPPVLSVGGIARDQVLLSGVTSNGYVAGTNIVRTRARRVGGSAGAYAHLLYCNTTLVASSGSQNLPTSWTTVDKVLTSAEYSIITDWNALYIRLQVGFDFSIPSHDCTYAAYIETCP